MGGIASQLHNLSIHGTNAAVSQQPTDMNGSVSNGAVSAGQSSGGSAVQPMTMHPSYTYPIYSYPFHYGVQVCVFLEYKNNIRSKNESIQFCTFLIKYKLLGWLMFTFKIIFCLFQ